MEKINGLSVNLLVAILTTGYFNAYSVNREPYFFHFASKRSILTPIAKTVALQIRQFSAWFRCLSSLIIHLSYVS